MKFSLSRGLACWILEEWARNFKS